MTIYYTKLEVGGINGIYYLCYYKRNSTEFIGMFRALAHPSGSHRNIELLEEKLKEQISFLSPYKLEIEPTEVEVEKRARKIYKDNYQ